MAHKLLELETLLTMSKLSDTAISDWVETDQGHIPLVAVADWILPKNAFVMVWYWYMLGNKIYAASWDAAKWDTIIYELNKNKVDDYLRKNYLSANNRGNVQWLDIIYNDLGVCYNQQSWTVAQKNEIFHQVIANLIRD